MITNLIHKPKRASAEGGLESEIRHTELTKLVGKKAEFIYLLPADLGLKMRHEKKLVSFLQSSSEKKDTPYYLHKLGVSKVNKVEEDYSGDLDFRCSTTTLQEGFYHRSPFDSNVYFSMKNEQHFVAQQVRAIISSILHKYGVIEEMKVLAVHRTSEERSKSVGVCTNIGGVVAGIGANASAEAKQNAMDTMYRRTPFSPSVHFFDSDVPKLDPTEEALLSKYKDLAQYLQQSWSSLKAKKDPPVKYYEDTIVCMQSSSKSIVGEVGLTPTAPLGIWGSFSSGKSSKNSVMFRLELKSFTVTKLQEVAKLAKERKPELLTQELYDAKHKFTTALRTFGNRKQLLDCPKSRSVEEDRALCVLSLGPKAAGKSSLLYTTTLAHLQLLDIHDETTPEKGPFRFKSCPEGIVIRLDTEAAEADGTFDKGVTEVTVYQDEERPGVVNSLILQDTVGLLDNEIADSKKMEELLATKSMTTCEESGCEESGMPRIPDAVIYVLDGQELALNIEEDKMQNVSLKLDQALEFMRTLHKGPENTPELPFVFALSKKDKVKDEEVRKKVIKCCKTYLAKEFPNVPFVFMQNLQWSKLQSVEQFRLLERDNEVYNEFKKEVINAFNSNLELMKTVAIEASRSCKIRDRRMFGIGCKDSSLGAMLLNACYRTFLG